MPGWVRSACDDYLRRLTGSFAVTLLEIEPGARTGSGNTQAALEQEARRLLAALEPKDHVVTLDERGRELTTREFASWLAARQQEGEDLAFVIGGPDGLPREVLARSRLTLSLSRFTLPHALARVVLAEQLYRAHSILTHHPYHRD
jgi:23S rRNA (pseudouridine1915-N3)-methyltransferase